MAIDELTDETLFEAYKTNPHVRKLVDDIQKKHGVYREQKGKPEYNEKNIPIATKEAKEAVQQLLAQQKGNQEKKIAASSGIFYGKMAYAAGLVGILATVATLYTFGAAAPLAAAAYTLPLY